MHLFTTACTWEVWKQFYKGVDFCYPLVNCYAWTLSKLSKHTHAKHKPIYKMHSLLWRDIEGLWCRSAESLLVDFLIVCWYFCKKKSKISINSLSQLLVHSTYTCTRTILVHLGGISAMFEQSIHVVCILPGCRWGKISKGDQTSTFDITISVCHYRTVT